MPKLGLAALAAAAVAAAFLTSEATGRERNPTKPSGTSRSERDRNYDRQRSDTPRGQYDPNSYDGRRTGQPRTCGHDFFIYDDQGTPMGPYCN
jgi:Ni/Co efflux regulator RcnB